MHATTTINIKYTSHMNSNDYKTFSKQLRKSLPESSKKKIFYGAYSPTTK